MAVTTVAGRLGVLPYEQLSRKLQQVNRSGGRVTKVDLA